MTSGIIKRIYIPLVVLGFSTSVVQVIMLREFVSLFYSNEIIFGIVLSVWMTLIGLGAWMGTKPLTHFSNRKLLIMYLLSGIFPLMLILFMYFIKSTIFPPGALISMWQLFPLIVIILAPGCLLAGNIFTILSKSIPDDVVNSGGKSYAIEAAGSIIGGLTVSIVMVLWLNTMQSLVIIFSVNLITASTCFMHGNRVIKVVTILLALIFPVIFFLFNIDLKVRQFLYPGQKVLETHETPYGNLTFTETAGQINVFESLSLQFTTENTVLNEETAHFPMLQHNHPSKVLLISGGISGIAKEILKYQSVKELVYVEPNPWLVNYALNYIKLPEDKRLNVVYRDGRNFITSDTGRYDVVIIALPEPSTLQLNRYYSSEFISILKRHCSENAVIGYSLNSSSNYLSHENRMVHSVLFNTLQAVFNNVIILPGEKNYFIASDYHLTSAIGHLNDIKKIQNKYVNPGFIDDRSLEERSKAIQKEMILDSPVNSDFKPVATSFQASLFFSRFKINSIGLMISISLLLLIPVIRLNSVSFSMYIIGFTASALEMIILLAFQIMFGYIYAASGIIFAVFMVGLTLGSLTGPGVFNNFNFRQLQFNQLLMVIMVLLTPVFLNIINNILINSLTYLVIFMLIFVPAVLTGFQFSLILKKSEDRRTGNTGFLYGADVFGSSLGLLLVSVFFLPLFGLFVTTVVLTGLNIISIAFLYLTNEKH